MRLRTIGAVGMVVCSIAADASSKLDDSPLLRPKKPDAGNGVVLTEFDGKTWALVADEDDSSIKVFETKPPREAATVKVAGTPSQLLVTKAGKGAGMLGGAAIAGYLTLTLLSFAAAWGLSEVVPEGVAFLIVGLVWAAIGGVLARTGKKELDQVRTPPPVTKQTIQEDVQWAKQQTS